MTGSVVMMPVGADIFASGAEVLVNTVDAATGAQGKGLAKAFAARFPAACAEYRKVARRGIMRAGGVWVYDLGEVVQRRWIFFATTKQHWRDQSHIETIATCAIQIKYYALEMGVGSVAVPALGCGQGGANWATVRGILESAGRDMAHAGIKVMIFPPHQKGSQ